MILCSFCNIKEVAKHKLTGKYLKYCSYKCAVKQCNRNRQSNPEKKEKHNLNERIRYKKIKRINSPKDYKKAPKGSGCVTKYGYRRLIKHGHPNSASGGSIFEHVYIMSEYLGRPLRKGETVHHKNGNRLDNSIENLELWSSSHPSGQRIKDKIEWCKKFLESYGYTVIMKKTSEG